jgi:hypothetical protein
MEADHSVVDAQDEAVLALSSRPLEADYQATLLRFAGARARFLGAPEQDLAAWEQAACQFQAAQQECDALEMRIMKQRRRTWL